MKRPFASSRSLSRLLAGGALTVAALLAPAALRAQEDIAVISNAAMDALEAWSSPSHSLEEMALTTNPEVFDAYLPVLRDHYRGQTLAEVFADQLPRTAALFADAFAEELAGGSGGASPGSVPDAGVPGDAEMLGFAMALENQEYKDWQTSLAGSRLDFQSYVKDQRPDLVDALADLNVTPAEQGISLMDFADTLDPTVGGELTVFASPTLPRRPCSCRVAISFTEIPSPWTQEVAESYYNQWGNLPHKKQQLVYNVTARGAARAINFYRLSEHNLWQVDRVKSTNSSSVRLRMTCSRGASAENCETNCQGDLALKVGYASRVYEKHDAGGGWSKQSEAFTGDLAQLFYTGPANLPTAPAPLFEKGVAVAGQFQTSWNPTQVGNLLFNLAQATVYIVTDNASAALDANLVNGTVNAIAGLVTHSGSPGNLSRDMMASWDSASSPAIVLQQNQTHNFELFGYSRIYSRGYGKWAWSWGNLDSADYFVGVVRDFNCPDGSTPPRDQGFWLQGNSSGAPWSAATLQNILANYLHVELGTPVPYSELASSQGTFP